MVEPKQGDERRRVKYVGDVKFKQAMGLGTIQRWTPTHVIVRFDGQKGPIAIERGDLEWASQSKPVAPNQTPRDT